MCELRTAAEVSRRSAIWYQGTGARSSLSIGDVLVKYFDKLQEGGFPGVLYTSLGRNDDEVGTL
jgi:hypothetical protein